MIHVSIIYDDGKKSALHKRKHNSWLNIIKNYPLRLLEFLCKLKKEKENTWAVDGASHEINGVMTAAKEQGA